MASDRRQAAVHPEMTGLTTDKTRITRAIDAVESEISAIRTEMEAFERFHKRLRPLPIALPATEPPAESATDLVVEIYLETVVATDDFDAAYHESRTEHMMSEFGTVLALRFERADHLTGDLKRGLLAATERSLVSRNQVIDVLEGERTSLRTADGTLAKIDERLRRTPSCSMRGSSLETVVDAWETLERLTAACESVAERRQAFLIEQRNEGFDFTELSQLDAYLYGDLNTIHPVLRTVVEILRVIETKKTVQDRSAVTA